MRHLKSFNESSFFITALGAAALLATVYNTVKRRAIVDRTKKRQFDKLGRLIDQWKNKDLKGKIIDNDDESQIVYEYGGADNLIIFHIDKVNKTFTFRWEFTQPMLPFMKWSDADDVTLWNLTPDELNAIQAIFDRLKNQKFKNQ